jgi:hypothetical protein
VFAIPSFIIFRGIGIFVGTARIDRGLRNTAFDSRVLLYGSDGLIMNLSCMGVVVIAKLTDLVKS